MRKLLIAACVVLWAGSASAQIDFRLPSSGTGTGSADPAQFSSPAGTLTIGGSVGAVTIDADTSVIKSYATGTSLPATCTPFATDFLKTDTSVSYDCIGTDTWTQRFTITDDSVLVGTGTATASKAIPDCDDSGGNHLNYDTTTNAFSCGTSGGAASFDPGTTVEFYDDFLGGTLTSGLIGSSGMSFTAVSTGTITNAVATVGTHPGVYRLNSHATNDNSGVALSAIHSGGTLSNIGTVWDDSDWSLDVVFMLGSNSTAITDTGFWIGLSSNIGTIPGTNGIFIRRDTDLSETAFAFVVCNSSGAAGCASAADAANAKVEASTITPSAGTWYRFRIAQDHTGPGSSRKISMRVNGETALTFCSSGCSDTLGTVPSGTSMTLVVQYLTRTTTGVLSGDIDYVYATITGLTRF